MTLLSPRTAARVCAWVAILAVAGCFEVSAASKRAVLAVAPSSLSFSAKAGGADPVAQTIAVNNTEAGR